MNFLKNLVYRYFLFIILIIEMCVWGITHASLLIGLQTFYYQSLCLPLSVFEQIMSGCFLIGLLAVKGNPIIISGAFLLLVAGLIFLLKKYVHLSWIFSFFLILLLVFANLLIVQKIGLKSLSLWTFFKFLLIIGSISLILQKKVDRAIA